jgi:hypothetical protein
MLLLERRKSGALYKIAEQSYFFGSLLDIGYSSFLRAGFTPAPT